jgi:hypothetical protein
MTATPDTQPQPFDEQAALAELERLADKIQLSRRQRAQAVAEFDKFVGSFREERRTTAGAARTSESALPDLAPASSPAPAVSHAEPAPPANPVAVPPESSDLWAMPTELARPASASYSAVARYSYVRIALVALGLVVIGLLLWRPWQSPASENAATTPATPAPAVATPPAGPSAPVAGATPAPVPARPLNVELVTVRSVWARVTVDDRRELQREIPEGQRLTFGADRAVTIRVGDAGAVRVIVDGKDIGAIGRDGFPATRTFTTGPSR